LLILPFAFIYVSIAPMSDSIEEKCAVK